MPSNATSIPPPPQISYFVTFPEAQAHYVNIEMKISGLTRQTVDLKMPVWTPGSYLVREYAKNVEGFAATSGGAEIAANKINKNTWRVTNGNNAEITVKYRVYSFEISVRTSFVDAAHGFLSSAGTFMYPDGMLQQPSLIHITPYKNWATVSTSLEPVNGDPFMLYSPNFDILFDSPIEVGTQDVFGFDAAGVKYEVAMCGGGNYDKERLKKDMARIVEEETAVFGENPNKRYVFIVHNYAKGGGGLEHLSSTVLGASRDAYANEGTYHNFLGLVAHEHFHLWNVKRLRPIALGPFDYDHENYTPNLWIAEGFTAYYQNVFVRRAGFYTPENYLAITAANINSVENQPGIKYQSLNDASFDAWIKLYRPNENSANSTISYYSKGAIIGMLLDLEIIHDSKGAKSLDDVMKYMYGEYYKLKQRGYTDAEFKAGLEKFAGRNLDEFYKKYIYGVEPVDYDTWLSFAGYQLTDDLAAKNNPFLGVVIAPALNGKLLVANVIRNTAAWVDGINVNDEITAIDGRQVTDLDKFIADKKVGDKLNVNVLRDGLPLTLQVTLLRDPMVKYRIEETAHVSPEMHMVRKKWLKL